MKLHKRILSAAAALLVLTSAVDLTQIAQFSLVAAAADVGDDTVTVDTDGETVDGEGTEPGGDKDDETDGDETDGEGDKTATDENGEGGENKGEGEGDEDDKTGGDEGDDENVPNKNPDGGENVEGDETGDDKNIEPGDGEEEKPSTGGSVGDSSETGDNKEVGDEIKYGGLKYLITDSNTVTVTGSYVDFITPELVIPSTVTNGSITYTVTAIAENALKEYGELESVTIPDSVTTIGEAAFYGCSNIKTVDIPSSVTSLGESAFGECEKLETVKFNGTREQWEALTKGNDIGLPEDFTVDCSDDTPGEITWNDKQNIPATTITRNTVITLDGDVKLSGTLCIKSGNVTITGNGNGKIITRHDDFLSTMILVEEGASLTIDNVTIDGNDVKANSAAIYNKGTLYINDSVVKNNSNTAVRTLADDNEATNALFVGGIANDGTLELTNSAVYGNTADSRQSNIVAEWNVDNKAVTIINSGIIVGEIDGVTLKNDVNRGTIETNAGGYFIVKNDTNEAVCTNGDFLYANPTGLKAVVGDSDIPDIPIDYDNLKWTFSKPTKKITWEANKVVDGIEITADTEITLNGNVALTGTIDIQSGNVTIIGNGNSITRGKNFQDTMFFVDEDASLAISNVTIDGNKNVEAYGAVIYNLGALNVNNCVIKNNRNMSARYALNALYVGGIANDGTLVITDSAVYGNTTSNDTQSNVKNNENAATTVNGGLIVGDIGGYVTLNNSVIRGTIKTNAKGSFTVSNGTNTKEVVCEKDDVLYANPTGLKARIGEQSIDIAYKDSEWIFSVKDDTNYLTGNDIINGIKINKDTEITLNGDITLTGTIDIESGNVTVFGNGYTIKRGTGFTDRMIEVDKGATLTVYEVIFDGNKANVQSGPYAPVIYNYGTLNIDRSTIKNNSTRSNLGTTVGDSHTISSGICNWGALELTNSAILDNNAWYGSGALTNVGDAYVYNCEIYNNTSTLVGGVDNHGNLTITNSRIHDNKTVDYDRPIVGGISGCTDNNMPHTYSTTTINGCSIYGNTSLNKQSNVSVTGKNRMSINDSLIVGEIAGNGNVTFDKDMLKGTVTANATDYFAVTNGTNEVACKPGDVLYARSANLTAQIGNKVYNVVYKDNKWVFSDTYTITYNLNGGTISGNFANPRTYLHGDKIEFPTPTRSGYTFGGWYSDQSFAHPVGDNVTAAGNATFYAKWTKNSGTSDPGTNQPGTNQPGTNQPGTNNPGTSQPGTSNPGTSNPGTSQPGISDFINKGVIIGTNAPQGVIVSTLSDLIRYVLTNSDIEALQNRRKIDISLGITNINGSAPQNDRVVIEEFIRTLNDYRLGYLLDLSLYKTVGSDRYIVRETSGELIIRIAVPETLRASGRTFAVVRVHNGTAKLLEDLDTDPNTITIKTDRFSTYAIIYKDQQSNSGSNSGNPETGNRTHPAVMIAPVASSLTLVVTAKRKKKEEE